MAADRPSEAGRPIKTDPPTLPSNRSENPFLSLAPHPCRPLPLAGIPLLSIRVHLPYLRAKVFSRSLPRFVLRQNFTTDFTDSTDKDFAFCILHSAFRTSVSSVQSVVQSSAVAAVRLLWPGFLPTHFRRLIKRQLREFPQQISKGFYPVNPVPPVKMSFLVKAAA